MSKFFVENNQINNDKINIIGESFNHIKNVLRLKVNDEIQICDIKTKKNYLCKIDCFYKDYIECNILSEIEKNTEPNTYINIFQGIPKSDKMEWIIEKCTEIGVSEFTPTKMERCVVKIENNAIDKKLNRWQKIAQSAAMQSGRNNIPKIEKIIDFNEIFDLVKDYDIILVAYENEKEITLKSELKKIKNNKNLKVAVIIGPEGRNKQK